MGDGPVVERVLDKLQEYLYDNLPPDEDFIIQLQNSGTINKDTARKLRALARNGDRSCIRDLITHLQEHGEEATLDKFCTSLEKYGKKGRPRMVTVAAKIREELKALGSPPSQATLPSQLAPPTQPTLPSLYQHREVRDERDFGGEVNEPGPSGSKRSQLHSDDQYSQPKRPYSTTKVPTAPRAGMDNQIGDSRDILGVPEYKDGLISKMPTLGDVLGIGNITDAILKSGDIDDQLRKILKHYIDKMSPTWRDFCTALEKDSGFNNVRKKIEADHNSKQRPGVADGDEPVNALKNVRFAIVTANDNEWESATFFMGTAMDKCKITKVLKEYLTKNFNFRELFETDGITVKFTGRMIQSYRCVSVCGVLGVLIKCTNTGSQGPNASGDTVTELLKTARSLKWDLLAVFLVGCCGCASHDQEKEGLLGGVLIAEQIIWYKGKFTEGKLKLKPPVTHTYNIDKEWVKPLTEPNKNTELSALQVQNVQCIPFLSGNFVVADDKLAEYQRTQIGSSVLGIEMEGAGAFEANSKKDTALHDNKRAAILVVKGVSDFANSKKNADIADTPGITTSGITDTPGIVGITDTPDITDFAFFNKTYAGQLQEKDFPTDEDSRQQMCTMMSLMIVFRAIKAKIVGKWN